jgi:hypothetical protein
MRTKICNVGVYLFEDDVGRTHAEAVLRTSVGTEVRHVGTAHSSPTDRNVPEIGDELAVCRALSGLAHDLLEATVADVQQNDPDDQAHVISIS